jgi:hypothetical protein
MDTDADTDADTDTGTGTGTGAGTRPQPGDPPAPVTPLLRRRSHGRLVIPADLPVPLGYDAVGMPAEYGKRVMASLPQVGCVFADDRRWWWIVPAGSHIGVGWPPFIEYSVGAHVIAPSTGRSARGRTPRLVHRPAGDSPYTPPIPLYFLTCHIADIIPSWSLTAGS